VKAITRPTVGSYVRIRGNTGIPGLAGRVGRVVAHHEDGVAFRVESACAAFASIVCDPSNVDLVSPS
jgi:hypothetical protein